MAINEIKYFNYKNLCDCELNDPNNEYSGCKIFPKGNLDISKPNKVTPSGIHCNLGTNPIIDKCNPNNINCYPGQGTLSWRKYMALNNTSQLNDEDAKKKCITPFVYDRRDQNNNVVCKLLPEPNMTIINKRDPTNLNNTKRTLVISNVIYEGLERQLQNAQDSALISCVSGLDKGINANVFACYENAQQYCERNAPKDKIRECIFANVRNTCLDKVETKTELQNCLSKFKNNFDDQLKCSPATQNYSFNECLPKTYDYKNKEQEILDNRITGLIDNYQASMCKPSIVENGVTFNYFDETHDECIYADIYPYQEIDLNAYYCTSLVPGKAFQNACTVTNDTHGNPFQMTDCKLSSFMPWDVPNSQAKCATKCKDGYYADTSKEFVKDKSCIKTISKKKIVTPVSLQSISTDWFNYCNMNNNIGKDECIKTINITETEKEKIGTEKCIGNIKNLQALRITYDDVAKRCTNINGQVYIVDRLVYIPKKFVNDKLEVQMKKEIIFKEYLKYYKNSIIEFDQYLLDAIDDGEFSVKLIEGKCNNSDIIFGYKLEIQRKTFNTNQEDCCDVEGKSYFKSHQLNNNQTNNINPYVIEKNNKRSTCDINIVKLNESCAIHSGNLTLASECRKGNTEVCPGLDGEDLKKCLANNQNICQKPLNDYCSSGGLNRWGDGIPRILDLNIDGTFKYPRCNVDFRRKYPDDYDTVLNEICNMYDNRDDAGITYYKTNPVCKDYCKNKGLKEVINKCVGNKISALRNTPEYKTNYGIQGNIACKPGIYSSNANSVCVRTFLTNFEKPFRERYERECLEENKNHDGCIRAQKNYCIFKDRGTNKKEFSRFFTSECQDLFSKEKEYGIVVESVCVMNRNNILYNYPECNTFRPDHQKCINDDSLSNNRVFKPECNKFCEKYKYICDLKARDICARNPFDKNCNDDRYKDNTNLDSNDDIFESSVNRRLASDYAIKNEKRFPRNKSLVDFVDNGDSMKKIKEKTDPFIDAYKLNFCLDKNRKSDNRCESYIKSKFNKKNNELLDVCLSSDNYINEPLCKKILDNRKEEFATYTKDFCLDETNKDFQFYESVICQDTRFNRKVKFGMIGFGITIGIIVLIIIIIKFIKK
jgi:hypothetical protein